jgi:hypothetical protein
MAQNWAMKPPHVIAVSTNFSLSQLLIPKISSKSVTGKVSREGGE